MTLYSNTLEDPGVISDETIGDSQLVYLKAALQRVKSEKFNGAVILAHHHPAYTAGSIHGWSIDMLSQIDAVCKDTGVWPHAVLSGHAHNYQRFTRVHGDTANSLHYLRQRRTRDCPADPQSRQPSENPDVAANATPFR